MMKKNIQSEKTRVFEFKTYRHGLTSWKMAVEQPQCQYVIFREIFQGGGPRVVVSTAAFHARVRGSVQYCGEPPWPRGRVLGLRPPGLEFRVLCLEDSVISIISPSSGGSPGLVYPICAQRWPKARFTSFQRNFPADYTKNFKDLIKHCVQIKFDGTAKKHYAPTVMNLIIIPKINIILKQLLGMTSFFVFRFVMN